MLPYQRKNKLEELLSQRIDTSINQLADMFEVSYSTIYRDLIELKEQYAFTIRNHRIIFSSSSILQKSAANVNDELVTDSTLACIVKKAIKVINEHDSIFIGMGSVCNQLALAITCDLRLSTITVVTNNFIVASILVPVLPHTYFVGGEVLSTHGYRYTSGSKLGKNLESIFVDKVFASVDGVDDIGLTVDDMSTYDTLTYISRISSKMIILAAKQCCRRRALHFFAPIDTAYCLIVDDSTIENMSQLNQQNNLKII